MGEGSGPRSARANDQVGKRSRDTTASKLEMIIALERLTWIEQMSTRSSPKNCSRMEVLIAWEKGDRKVAFQVMK
jgi:hypothetical protein